MLTVKLY